LCRADFAEERKGSFGRAVVRGRRPGAIRLN
jgi:hypothetical protein